MVNLVFKNQADQVVRSYLFNSNEQVHLVLLKDSKRLDLVSNFEQLESQDIEFDEIQSFKASELSNKEIQISPRLTISTLKPTDKAQLSKDLAEKKQDKSIGAAVGASTIFHSVFLTVILLTGFLLKRYFPEEPKEIQVVVMNKAQLEELVQRPEPVKVAEKKVQLMKRPHAPVKIPVTVKPRKKLLAQTQPTGYKQDKFTEVGTLKTLDKIGGIGESTEGTTKGTGFGNSKQGAFGTRAGMGGGLGSGVGGGIKNALMGKGLVAGLSGDGSKSFGAHGYGNGKYGGGTKGFGGASVGSKMGTILVPDFDDSEIVGGLTREQVESVVRKNQGQLRFCYEKALQSKPELRGRLTSKWVIGAAGQVKIFKLTSSSMPSRDVENCVSKAIQSWQFPKPVGGVSVDVTYPFDFGRLQWMAKEG